MNRIELRSDNSAEVAPEIMEAIVAANAGGAMAYGGDDRSARLEQVVREVFEHPGARIFPVSSGTAANALALSAMCPPWGLVFTHQSAHALNTECAAASMFGGGLAIRGVAGDDFLIDPSHLVAAFDAVRLGDNHHSQPRVVSLTQATDMGTIYSVDHVAELASLAHARDCRVHIDGARIANAIAALGCSPADLTWRAGVDAISLGAIKNGAMSADAVVTFDDSIAEELVYRTKRSGHVTSKMRFLSAQLIAYLTDGLWLRLAGDANARMAELSAGLSALGVPLLNRPDVNMLFAEVTDEAMRHLRSAGVDFYDMRPGVVRFVTSWQTGTDDVAAVLDHVRAALGSTV